MRSHRWECADAHRHRCEIAIASLFCIEVWGFLIEMRNSRNDCKADTSMQPKIPNGRVLEREVFPTKISHFYVIPIYGILMLLIVQRKIDGNKKFVRWRLVHRMRWWYCIIRYTNRPNYIGDVVRFDEFSCDASDRRAVDFAVVTLYDSTGT